MAPKSKAQRRREWWEKFWGELGILNQIPNRTKNTALNEQEIDKQLTVIDAHIRRGLRMARKGEI